MEITSSVEICNMGLDHLKVPHITSIDSPADDTERLCALWYDFSRREALRAHPWNFAKDRTVLNRDATAPTFGYSDRYKLPNDFIRLRFIDDQNLGLIGVDYDIEGEYLLLDNDGAATLNIGYIKDEDNPIKFDALFTKYLSLLLASNMCVALTGKSNLKASIEAALLVCGNQARAINGQDKPPVRVTRSRVLGARRTYSTGSVNPTDPSLVPLN